MSPMIYCNLLLVIVYPSRWGKRLQSWAVSTGSRWACRACASCTAARPPSWLDFWCSAGVFLGQPLIHEVGLVFAMMLGAIALGRGVRGHGFVLPAAVGMIGLGVMAYALTLHETGLEPIFTLTGVMILRSAIG